MKVWLPLLLCAWISFGILSCKKSSNSSIPTFALNRLSPDTIKFGRVTDTVYITFRFTDGDGDLGNDPSQRLYDLYLADDRTEINDTLKFFFPEIPADAIDPVEGIMGEGSLAVGGSLIRLRTDTLHVNNGDTVRYNMWIRDKAGNTSAPLRLPPIFIRP
jgi:hypothetical protein